jgi:hypothetical protein
LSRSSVRVEEGEHIFGLIVVLEREVAAAMVYSQ